MAGEVTVGTADLGDPAIRRLVEPSAMRALEAGSSNASVVQVKGVPVAVAAARLHPGHSEMLSLACLTEAWATPAPGWAVDHLRRSVPQLIFEPDTPVTAALRDALCAGGLEPKGPLWLWYEVLPAEVMRRRQEVNVNLPVATLADVTIAGLTPHPADLPEVSPVVVDAGQPVGYAVVREAAGGYVVQWLWIEPSRRRAGVAMQVAAALVDRIGDDSPTIRFRVDASNTSMVHLVEGALDGFVRQTWQIPTWVGSGLPTWGRSHPLS